MKLAQIVRLGALILIGLNLLMAFGSIWVFTRMAPAIEIIIEQNQKSLIACEEMLASLARLENNDEEADTLKADFETALTTAQNNITEDDEPEALAAISNHYALAFEGDVDERHLAIEAIVRLGEINRNAMAFADIRARQQGTAGAWGVVFMATAVFLVGMLFRRSLEKNLVQPLEEIHTVLKAAHNGDNMRRCTGTNVPRDIRSVYSSVNELLDRKQPAPIDDYKG